MTHRAFHRQQGLSLWPLLIVLIVLAALAAAGGAREGGALLGERDRLRDRQRSRGPQLSDVGDHSRRRGRAGGATIIIPVNTTERWCEQTYTQ